MILSLKYNILIMPKPYKKREFEYHFSQDDEKTIFNFKKDFTILLAFLFPKEWSVKKGHSHPKLITLVFILVIIIILIIAYYFNSK